MTFRLLRALAALMAALTLAPFAFAVFDPETGRPSLRVFPAAEYDAHYQVLCMTPGPDGVRYFGYFGGILEYDGATWRHLDLPGRTVRSLAYAPDGRLYVGATNEFGYCDRDATGALVFHSLIGALPAEALPAGPFTEVAVQGGAVYFTTQKAVVRWQDGKARVWPVAGTGTLRLNPMGSRLWARRMGANPVLELRGDDWVPVIEAAALAGKRFNFIVPGPGGAPIFGVSASGLWRLTDGQLVPWVTPATALLAKAELFSARALIDGSIAVCTFTDGLVLISPDGQRARQLTISDGLPSDFIEGVGTDAGGRLWICTYNGIATLDWPASLTLFDRRAGFDPSAITTMRRQDGRLLLGGLGGVFAVQPADPAGPRTAVVTRVSQADDFTGDPIQHASGPLYPSTNGIKTLRAGRPELVLKLEDFVMTLATSRRDPNRIFFGTQKGLGSAYFSAGTWRVEGVAPDFNKPVWGIALGTDDSIWLRTVAGEGWHLGWPAGAGPDWTKARVEPMAGIPGWPEIKSGRFIFSDTALGLVFFTPERILRFDEAARRFVPDTRFDRATAPAGELFPISDYSADGLWCAVYPEGWAAGRRHAVGRFALGADGVARWQALPPEIPAVLGAVGAQQAVRDPAHAGVVWLRGTEAVARLETSLLAPPDTRRAPLLRQLRLGATAQPLPAGDVAAKFGWSRETVNIQFAVPGSGTRETRFQTRLVGWNSAWSAPSARTDAAFSGLVPGRYQFEVVELDAEGHAGPAARLAFVLNPPPWLTWWAFAGYALALAALIFLYIRWRLGRVERERARLAALVEARTADLALARDAAEAASRAKSHFVASMSHELRTPLNSIIGYAQILATHEAATPWQRERLGVINTSGAHLLRLINDVLDFARVEAGRLEVRSAPFDLTGLLGEVSAAGRVLAENKKLGWRVTLPAAFPAAVVGDAARLRQVLDNLLGNAVKFTAAGEVALEVTRRGALYEFTVRDTGPGIAADDQARLFHAFEQTATGAHAGGAGLGLAISRQLAERMGGTLSVRSAPGAGSAFTVVLPLPDSTGAAVAAPSGWQPPRGYTGPRRTLLVLDDVAQNRDVIRDTLEPLGFTVRDAADTIAARAVLAAGGIDLVILDLRLPGEDGFAFARWLRATPAHARLPVVAMSASVLPSQRADALAAGADLFLPKPFAQPELLDALAQLLKVTWLAGEATALTEGAVNGVRLPAPVVPTVPVPRDLLAEFSELATLGDIAALQALIEKLAASPGQAELAAELGALINAFELAALRQRLAALRAG